MAADREPASHGNRFSGAARTSFQGRDVYGDVMITGRVTRLRWLVAAGLLAVTLVVGTIIVARETQPSLAAGTPVTQAPRLVTTQDLELRCALRHVEDSPDNVDVERVWATNADAVLTTYGIEDGIQLVLTLQNPSAQELLIMGVGVDIRRRQPPPDTGFFMPSDVECGGGLPVRSFNVDLNVFPPRVTSVPGEDDDGNPVPAVAFPYQIRQGDPEIFRLRFAEVSDHIDFTITLDVVIEGRRQTVMVDRDGNPYRLTGTGSRPLYHLVNDNDSDPPEWKIVPGDP